MSLTSLTIQTLCKPTAFFRVTAPAPLAQQALRRRFSSTSRAAMASDDSCIFCKIIKGDIPCFKLAESDKLLAFLDIQPLSRGHALVIPKHHGRTLTDIPDEYLTDILPVVKKLATASGAENWNCLQNNGRAAHQEVDHVHFHMIPKPNKFEGLEIGWPATETDMDKLKALHADLKAKM